MNESILIKPELGEGWPEMPPTQDELPDGDGMPMETSRHKYQMDLLLETLYNGLENRKDVYMGGDMFLYYSMKQVRNRDFIGPDFFAVTGVSNEERKSWVVWEEGKTPDVIIELLSNSTMDYDKKYKKQLYQDELKVSEYFWYYPFGSDDFAGFALEDGIYQELPEDDKGRLICSCLDLALVRWKGIYRGIDTTWLRWAKIEGDLLPTDKEISAQEKAIAEQERAIAEQERTIAEQQKAIAEQEKAYAEQQKLATEQEKDRANAAEEKLKKLLAQMQALGITPDIDDNLK